MLEFVIAGGISFIGALISAGVGVGGGSFYLPVLIEYFGNTHAVPLSKVNIFAVGLAALIVNFPRTHPKAERPLINYDVALLLEPVTILGTISGVTMNVVLPSTVIRIFLIAFLGILTLITVRLGIQQMSKETAEEAAQQLLLLNAQDDEWQRQISGASTTSVASSRGSRRGSRRGGSWASKSLLDQRYEMFVAAQQVIASQNRIPWGRIFVLITAAFFCYGLEVVSESGLAVLCGGQKDIALLAAAALCILLFTFGWAMNLVRLSKFWAELGLDDKRVYGDPIVWTWKNICVWLVIAFVAGLCAGATGISGGLVKGPMMIYMGICPWVAAATSSFMILFTSWSTTLQFWMLGRIDITHACLFGSCAFVGGLLGQLLFLKLVTRYKRQSLVTMWLGIAVGLSALCTALSDTEVIEMHHATRRVEDLCHNFNGF